jgi:hypothetical protein
MRAMVSCYAPHPRLALFLWGRADGLNSCYVFYLVRTLEFFVSVSCEGLRAEWRFGTILKMHALV